MPYSKQAWADGAAGGTPISAGRLAHIEDGLYYASRRFDVQAYGAVGNGTTNDTTAIQAALTAAGAAGGGTVSIPAGTFLVSTELKIPSRCHLTGAGMDVTTIVMAATADGELNVLTNASNNRAPRTTYDEFITISDLTVDGNGTNRASSTTSISDGSCVELSTVRYCLVERVRAVRGWRHDFDISASEYPYGTGVTAVAQGPSYYVTIRNCIAESPTTDDAFTTHYSWGLRLEDCRAYTTTPNWTSQGFEIDDGSRDVVVSNCYAFGFTKGFQVKGHDVTTPARQIVLENCVADGCGYGYDITHDDPTGTSSPYRVAADVVLRSCRSLNNVTKTNYPERYALRIMGYDGVKVHDFVSFGSTGGTVMIGLGCSNVELDGLVFENVFTAPNAADSGLVHCLATTGNNITVKNMRVRSAITQSAVRVSTTAGNVLVRDVQAFATSGTTYPCVSIASLDSNQRVENVMATGFASDIQSTGGSIVGTFAREAAARVDGASWTALTLPSTWTGSINYTRVGKTAFVQLSAVTPPAGFVSAIATAATLPAGHCPIRQTNLFASSTTSTGRDAWVASDGQIRSNFVASTAVTGLFVYPIGN